MHAKRFITKNMFLLGAITASNVYAIGLYVPYQSAADMSDGRSATAAAARDASTNFSNPAGLTRFSKPQFVFSDIISIPYYQFHGTMFNPGLGSPIFERGEPASRLMGLIPAFHYVYPLSEKAALGISSIIPSGLGFDYKDTSIVRYEVVRTTLATTSLSPSFAYKILPNFSVAFGPDMLYSVSKTKTYVRTQPFTPGDSVATAYGSNIDWGFHLGVLYEFSPCTRVGVLYRTKSTLHLHGHSRLWATGPFFPARSSSNHYKNLIPLASLVSASVYHEPNTKVQVGATFEYMDWSVWNNDKIFNLATPAGPVSLTLPRKLRDTWFISTGGSYRLFDDVLVRAGVGYAIDSTTKRHREVTLPDPNVWIIAAGIHFPIFPTITADLGFNHSFFKKAHINHINPSTGDHLIGSLISDQSSVGVQINWTMG